MPGALEHPERLGGIAAVTTGELVDRIIEGRAWLVMTPRTDPRWAPAMAQWRAWMAEFYSRCEQLSWLEVPA